VLEDHQVEYQPTMVEFEGKLVNRPISILIDFGASLSYVNLKLVEMCHVKSIKFRNPWLVQMATGATKIVSAKVEECPIEIGGQQIKVNLNLLPLGSYHMLMGMDWLEIH